MIKDWKWFTHGLWANGTFIPPPMVVKKKSVAPPHFKYRVVVSVEGVDGKLILAFFDTESGTLTQEDKDMAIQLCEARYKENFV